MREIRTSGSVGARDGDDAVYPTPLAGLTSAKGPIARRSAGRTRAVNVIVGVIVFGRT
jgi:hypothetical protein